MKTTKITNCDEDKRPYKERCGHVVNDWLTDLSYKQQTVVLTALRGCDGVPKEDLSKKLIRKLRSVILKSAISAENDIEPVHFMKCELTPEDITQFASNLDHYPMHWLLHFAHAAEIIGYFHPDKAVARFWAFVYNQIVAAMHLRPEPKDANKERLRDLL